MKLIITQTIEFDRPSDLSVGSIVGVTYDENSEDHLYIKTVCNGVFFWVSLVHGRAIYSSDFDQKSSHSNFTSWKIYRLGVSLNESNRVRF